MSFYMDREPCKERAKLVLPSGLNYKFPHHHFYLSQVQETQPFHYPGQKGEICTIMNMRRRVLRPQKRKVVIKSQREYRRLDLKGLFA